MTCTRQITDVWKKSHLYNFSCFSPQHIQKLSIKIPCTWVMFSVQNKQIHILCAHHPSNYSQCLLWFFSAPVCCISYGMYLVLNMCSTNFIALQGNVPQQAILTWWCIQKITNSLLDQKQQTETAFWYKALQNRYLLKMCLLSCMCRSHFSPFCGF